MKASPGTRLYLGLQAPIDQCHSKAFSQTQHPHICMTMLLLPRVKVPKETARVVVIFHTGKYGQCTKKLQRNYTALEAEPRYDQQAGVHGGFPKQSLYLCSAAVPQPSSCPYTALSCCPVTQSPVHPSPN